MPAEEDISKSVITRSTPTPPEGIPEITEPADTRHRITPHRDTTSQTSESHQGSYALKTNQVRTVMLNGVPIVALVIESKERLCLAQISSTLLKSYSYNEIHNRRVALGITCVQCTPVQLEILRRAGAMPISSRRCGMITKREAERLCKSFLTENAPPRLPENFAFEVFHECSWGCRGSFIPSRYNSSRAKCIKCAYCNMFFSPNKFIFHSHRLPDSKYTQPDAADFNSWRRHLKLVVADSDEDTLHAWEGVKAMFNGGTRKRIISNSASILNGKRPRQEAESQSNINNMQRSPYLPVVPVPNKSYGLVPGTNPYVSRSPHPTFPIAEKAMSPTAIRQSFADYMWSGKQDSYTTNYGAVMWPKNINFSRGLDSGLHSNGFFTKNNGKDEPTDSESESLDHPRREIDNDRWGDESVRRRLKSYSSESEHLCSENDETDRTDGEETNLASSFSKESTPYPSAFKPVIRGCCGTVKDKEQDFCECEDPQKSRTSGDLSDAENVDINVTDDDVIEGNINECLTEKLSENNSKSDEEKSQDFQNSIPNVENKNDSPLSQSEKSKVSTFSSVASVLNHKSQSPVMQTSIDENVDNQVNDTRIEECVETNHASTILSENYSNSGYDSTMHKKLEQELQNEIQTRKKIESDFQLLKESFQEQIKREFAYREEMAKQLQLVRDALCHELDQERKARYAVQQKLKEAHDALHHFSCKMLASRHCTECSFKQVLPQ